MTSYDLIVTRHANLRALLLERQLVTFATPVLDHVKKASQVRGLHVIGVLPHHLSAEAASITEIPIRHTVSSREAMAAGDIPLDELRVISGAPVTYSVNVASDPTAPSLAFAAAVKYCEGFDGRCDGPFEPGTIGSSHWRGLHVTHFGSTCQQFSAAVVGSRGIWHPLQGDQAWLDGLEQPVDIDKIEGALGWPWVLKGVKGFDVDVETAELRFDTKRQAWAAADRIFGRTQLAGGPHGVAAIVHPVPM
jgi:hypothetical protein